MKTFNENKPFYNNRFTGFLYPFTLILMGVTGFGQMPIFKRYYLADLPGFGWKDTDNDLSIKKGVNLFPRVDLDDFLKSEESPDKEEKKPIEEKEKIEMEEGLISFDEFQKVEMVVAQVKNAEKIESADKLLKLEVDTGTDERTLVAGIALHYEPEELTGKKIIIVKNLKPVKLRGVLSQGMILAASDGDGRPYIPEIPSETPVGAILK